MVDIDFNKLFNSIKPTQNENLLFTTLRRRKKRTRAEIGEQWRANVDNRYKTLIRLPQGYNDMGDGNCGVVAMALAAKVPYNVMFAKIKSRFQLTGRWRGATYTYWYPVIFKLFGVETEHTKPVITPTVRAFVRDIAKLRTTYVVRIKHHIFIIRGNYVIDQRGAVCLAEDSKLLKSMALEWWEVKEKAAEAA